jgi:hypothetical protein
MMTTLRMKITKVQGILFDLASVRRRENVSTNLALDNYDQTVSKNNRIDASAKPVQRVLKENCPVFGLGTTFQEFGKNALKLGDDLVPSPRLARILRHEAIRCVRLLKKSDYGNWFLAKELVNCSP